MNIHELVTKQQLEIEESKGKKERNLDILQTLNYRMIGIGQPLNDNLLKMNKNQLLFVYQIKELIDKIEP